MTNKNNIKRISRKLGGIVLSAVLFGGTAAFAFQGVNALTAAGSPSETASSENTDDTKVARLNTAGSDSTPAGSMDVSEIASNVMPSVVAITNKSVQEVQDYFGMFGTGGGIQTQEVESRGSGIIIGQNDSELLIATNNHVVDSADTLSVCFVDNSVYSASVKGTDADNDLAVIAVPLDQISGDTMSQIKVAAIGDSDSLSVGEQVVAIGNALGYGQSVTTGIVSALDRKIDDNENSPALIQTDAAINPGNSGGALVNMNGELIGINSAKFASTEVEGMGYAIPTATASPIIQELMNQQTREKVSAENNSYLGISGQDVDSETSAAYNIPTGVYVSSVTAESPAGLAGIRQGMVITGFDGKSISGIEELKHTLQYYAAGETVDLTVQVNDSGTYEEQTISVTLGSSAQDSNSVDTVQR
ncbi:S1C family serine protease [Ruminococcus gauvreauii]|uniref:Trypsin-like peptidase domain-containing protein n=1 Tax=Ruminococcus gauvreauii TaxID=438033 RepID=A0ABY5VJD9_9FIRM|nr:trypsin-like peptidase domain-containing protein [Ruminococcus gauvreauii]UWP60346.1 trypsin-like peptidase domain-containing protein [Ruminococcus gauvreauii]